jgi:hypothetical protein
VNKIQRVIAEIEAYKPWLWEAKANARLGYPLSICEMKKAMKKADATFSYAFYNKLRAASIEHFKPK